MFVLIRVAIVLSMLKYLSQAYANHFLQSNDQISLEDWDLLSLDPKMRFFRPNCFFRDIGF